MKTKIFLATGFLAIIAIATFFFLNTPSEGNTALNMFKSSSNDFDGYWYQGEAEITSYKLQQARYGEIREGNAVLVFVTEPFLTKEQVKADNPNSTSTTVLKLNATKNFVTGIYPYSIMTSTFYPVDGHGHALKVTNSVQEWCGQVYAQLNNRKKFEIRAHSYFETEGDQDFTIEKAPLENEVFTQIRVNPNSLPTGKISMVPSFEFTRLMHKPIKAYAAEAGLIFNDSVSSYKILYPELERELVIHFSTKFPYTIEGWEETYKNGNKTLTSTAKKNKSIKSAYWTKNRTEHVSLRDSLGL